MALIAIPTALASLSIASALTLAISSVVLRTSVPCVGMRRSGLRLRRRHEALLYRGGEKLTHEVIESDLFLTGQKIESPKKTRRDMGFQIFRIPSGKKRLGRQLSPTFEILKMNLKLRLKLFDNILLTYPGRL